MNTIGVDIAPAGQSDPQCERQVASLGVSLYCWSELKSNLFFISIKHYFHIASENKFP